MKARYKGYEIEVTRQRCLGGWSMLYFSIFRESDGLECLTNFADCSETVREMIGVLKERIDNEHATDDPWCLGEVQET